MVLRAGSNYTVPPSGVTAAENLLAERKGYTGMTAALEALYQVGSTVIDEISSNWTRWRDEIPAAAARSAGRDLAPSNAL